MLRRANIPAKRAARRLPARGLSVRSGSTARSKAGCVRRTCPRERPRFPDWLPTRFPRHRATRPRRPGIPNRARTTSSKPRRRNSPAAAPSQAAPPAGRTAGIRKSIVVFPSERLSLLAHGPLLPGCRAGGLQSGRFRPSSRSVSGLLQSLCPVLWVVPDASGDLSDRSDGPHHMPFAEGSRQALHVESRLAQIALDRTLGRIGDQQSSLAQGVEYPAENVCRP